MASWQRKPAELSGDWIAYRQVGEGFPAFWHPGSRYQPTEQPDARWHRRGESYVQYCSLSTDGCWAELVRYEGIRTEDARREQRVRLWQLWISETVIADLRDFDTIEGCGLDPAIFVDDVHASCQDLALELRENGYRGLLYPSAALPGVTNFALFGARRELFSAPGLVSNPRPDTYVTVNLAADLSAPPAAVMDATRLYGDAHLGYERWLASKL